MVVDYETAVSLIYSVTGNMCAANKSKSGLPSISGPQPSFSISFLLFSFLRDITKPVQVSLANDCHEVQNSEDCEAWWNNKE